MEEEILKNETTNSQTEVVKYNKVPAIIMIIVSVLVGGAIGIGFAIAALVTGSNVETLVANGNIEEAKKKLKLAKTFLLVTYIWDGIVAVFLIAYILFIVAAVVASI